MIKSVYFAAKSIDFAAGESGQKARQGGCLRCKSFILRGLGKKPKNEYNRSGKAGVYEETTYSLLGGR